MSDGFLDRYQETISSMGAHPDKITINQLTMTAGEVKRGLVRGVSQEDLVGVIESKLLRSEHKLPILYLIDSIMYNEGGQYPELFAKQAPPLFMDAYRSANQKDRDRLKRLLGLFMNGRPPNRTLPVETIADIHKRMDPSFDVNAFLHKYQHRILKKKPPSPARPSSRGAPHPMSMSSGPPIVPGVVSQEQYNEMLHREAESILASLQEEMRIPMHERMGIHELHENPPFSQQVYDHARAALDQQGVRMGAAPSIPAPMIHNLDAASISNSPSAPSPGPAALSPQPRTAPRWDVDSIRDGNGLNIVGSKLYFNSIGANSNKTSSNNDGSFTDDVSTLTFPDERSLKEYQAHQSKLNGVLKELVPDGRSLIARNWFASLEDWINGKPRTEFVDGSGFDDDDQLNEDAMDTTKAALDRQGSTDSMDPSKYSVPVDSSQEECPMTGQRFETYFDEDDGEWKYKDAIRPDPNGPIYLASAYLQRNAKRKAEGQNEDDDAKKLKT